MNDRTKMSPMRSLIICGPLALAALLIEPHSAAHAAWCAVNRNGGVDCSYSSREQCMASMSGTGGFCRGGSATGEPARSGKAAGKESRKPRKERAARQKPASPVPAAATAVAPAVPAAAAPPMPASFIAARDLVIRGQYEAGIAAMQALGFDDHPDVATYIGLANRKLGRIDDARSWYEKALAADPGHLLTLSFYGMLRAELGDVARAKADLETIRQLCGSTDCNEYRALQGVIASQAR
jgi:hypothetical protein